MINKWQIALSAVAIIVLVVIFILVGRKSDSQTLPDSPQAPPSTANASNQEIPTPPSDTKPWKE